jgi:hypothetical protein
MQTLYALFIVNKSGGLVYHRELSEATPRLSTNDTMILGSTWHGMLALAEQVAPVHGSGGIHTLVADTFVLKSFSSATGLKIFIIADAAADMRALDQALRRVYALYADFALKDPFYQLEQAIRSPLFDAKIDALSRG